MVNSDRTNSIENHRSPPQNGESVRKLCRDDTTPRSLSLPQLPNELSLVGNCSFFDVINHLPMPHSKIFAKQTNLQIDPAGKVLPAKHGEIFFSGQTQARICTDESSSHQACVAARKTKNAPLRRLKVHLPNDIVWRDPKSTSDASVAISTDKVTVFFLKILKFTTNFA